ncbi:MAG: DUF3846 domain-containing protein [Candidatus Dormibacteraeota bacterium]|nr:DUF3846 domain-containing protein [Candidatus Dormibacteraeota bacterium]
MSFTLLVPADDSLPIVPRELSEGGTVSAQARQLFGGLWEVVRARDLNQLAPELWPVMLVDENGHGKGLPLNRRGGELYGADAIAGDVLICQERRTSFWVDELRSFTQEEAERLRDLLFRQTGRGRG